MFPSRGLLQGSRYGKVRSKERTDDEGGHIYAQKKVQARGMKVFDQRCNTKLS